MKQSDEEPPGGPKLEVVPRIGHHRRLNTTAIALLQLGGTGLSFLGWALVANVSSPMDSIIAVRAYAWALLIFQPLSLGLPYVLPNEYRRGTSGTESRRRAILLVLLAVTIPTAVTGAALTFGIADTWKSLGLAVLLAAVTCLAIAIQQIARVRQRPVIMLFATLYTVLLPAAWYLSETASDVGLPASVQIATAVLVVYFLLLALFLRKSIPAREQGSAIVSTVNQVLRTSLSLVPHLFAFGALMQGIRVLGSLSTDSQLVNQTHLLMLVISAGFTLTTTVHTLLAVRVQTLSAAELPHALRRTAMRYLFSGLISSAVVLTLLLLPVERVLPGIASVSTIEIGALTLLPGLLSAYYFLSSLFIRFGFGGTLSAVTVTVVLFLTTGYLAWMPFLEVGTLILLYTSAMVLLLALMVLAAMGRRKLRMLPILFPIAITTLGAVPGATVVLVGLLL